MRNKETKLIINWLIRYFFSHLNREELKLMFSSYWSLIKDLKRTRGLGWTIKYNKAMRLAVTRYMSGYPLKTSPKLSLSKSGFPNRLNPLFKEYVDSGSVYKIRWVLTLLTISRSFVYIGTPDYSSITDPYTGKSDFSEFKEFIPKFVEDFNLYIDKPWFSTSLFYMTRKSGPLGDSLMTCLDHIRKYNGTTWNAFQSMIPINWMQDYFPVMTTNDSEIRNRKLAIINDPEGKSRVIAIYDYFTQVILEHTSKRMFNLLKTKFSQDRTFTQDPIIKTDGINKYHSLDLSSATDRFPIQLQQLLLSVMMDRRYSFGWGLTMVGESFHSKIGQLYYAVGQPMGARTSWPMFTISHHFIIQYCAYLVGKYPTKAYIMLGDDVVITDDIIASKYKEVIKSIGVTISEQKSHVSQNTYEFAKRWFKNGIEVSPIPINGIVEGLTNPINVYSVMNEQRKRMLSPMTTISVVDLSCQLFRNSRKYCMRMKYLRSVLQSFHVISNWDSLTNEVKRSFICWHTRKNDYQIQSDIRPLFKGVIGNVLNGVIYMNIMKLRDYHSRVTAVVAKIIESSKFGLKDGIQLPQYWAFANAITQNCEAVDQITRGNWDLSEIVDTLTLTDPDLLAKRQRKSKTQLFTMTKISKQAVQGLIDDPSEVIGNYTRMAQAKHLNHSLKFQFTKGELKN